MQRKAHNWFKLNEMNNPNYRKHNWQTFVSISYYWRLIWVKSLKDCNKTNFDLNKKENDFYREPMISHINLLCVSIHKNTMYFGLKQAPGAS